MKFLTTLAFLLGFSFSYGQTTSVVATVIDPSGQHWINGSVAIQFSPNPQFSTATYYWNNAPLPTSYNIPTVIPLDNAGYFSYFLPSSTAITPAGSSWKFVLCPNSTSTCQTIITSVSGSTDDLGSLFTQQLNAISIPGTSIPKAYADTEIQTVPNQGTIYYNVLTLFTRIFSGTTWSNLGGSGGTGCTPSGTTSQVLFNSGGGCTGTAGLTADSSYLTNMAGYFGQQTGNPFSDQVNNITSNGALFQDYFTANITTGAAHGGLAIQAARVGAGFSNQSPVNNGSWFVSQALGISSLHSNAGIDNTLSIYSSHVGIGDHNGPEDTVRYKASTVTYSDQGVTNLTAATNNAPDVQVTYTGTSGPATSLTAACLANCGYLGVGQPMVDVTSASSGTVTSLATSTLPGSGAGANIAQWTTSGLTLGSSAYGYVASVNQINNVTMDSPVTLTATLYGVTCSTPFTNGQRLSTLGPQLIQSVISSTPSTCAIGVTSVVQNAAGSGMANGTYPIIFSGGTGSGAAGTVTIATNVGTGVSTVSGVSITSNGVYSVAPTATIGGSPGGTLATLTVSISGYQSNIVFQSARGLNIGAPVFGGGTQGFVTTAYATTLAYGTLIPMDVLGSAPNTLYVAYSVAGAVTPGLLAANSTSVPGTGAFTLYDGAIVTNPGNACKFYYANTVSDSPCSGNYGPGNTLTWTVMGNGFSWVNGHTLQLLQETYAHTYNMVGGNYYQNPYQVIESLELNISARTIAANKFLHISNPDDTYNSDKSGGIVQPPVGIVSDGQGGPFAILNNYPSGTKFNGYNYPPGLIVIGPNQGWKPGSTNTFFDLFQDNFAGNYIHYTPSTNTINFAGTNINLQLKSSNICTIASGCTSGGAPGTPAGTFSTGAGSGPSALNILGGSDMFEVSFNTGTSPPSNSTVIIFTWPTTYSSIRGCQATPGNDAAVSVPLYMPSGPSNVTTSGAILRVPNGSSLAATTTYIYQISCK